ncbi:MAG: AAA family ATPase [Rhodospirillales bacterium]|nr:MAG: AAA family ATPase [Rhodospirillales bacterium]
MKHPRGSPLAGHSTIRISDLTLDEVVLHLIAGHTLQASGGEEFSLSLPDSRAILAFYNQDRRTYWNPEKDPTIQDGEIDRVLDALDTLPKAATAAARPAATLQKWRLVRVVAHRFRGLHRHCAEAGADPHPFELELAAHASLFRGFNGAGKTSLVSAICWCLTGYGHRSQGLPSVLHEPIQVQVRADDGNGDGEAKDKSFPLPVIVPIPTEAELVAVDGVPKVDTWVRLTFRSLIDGREVDVERRLERDGKRAFKTTATGLDKLGLPDLALQVGTLMPGIAAATRFDDKTTLSQAVSTLTGLRPLAHFGKRSERLHDRLTDKYPKQANDEKTGCEITVGKQLQTLADLLKDGEGLPNLDCVVAPTDAKPDAWKAGLEEAENRLKTVETKAAADALLILDTLPPLTAETDVTRFSTVLTAAANCFSPAALKGLPSMQLSSKIGEMTAEHMTDAELVLQAIEAEAAALVAHLSDTARADRLRLYGLVAKWHDAIHPGKPLTDCPVCARDLNRPGAIPQDALLDRSVAEALNQARTADAAMLKTAAEWEHDAKQALRGRLPATVQLFVEQEVPDDLAALYEAALSKEVFALTEFPAMLKKMAPGIAALCRAAWKDAPQRDPLPGVSLPPEIPDNEGLRAAIKNVRRAVQLARYRAAHAEFAKRAMTGVLRADKDETNLAANCRSIDGKLAVLKAYRDAATVFAGIRRQLAQIKETCEKWAKLRLRIAKLARAAKAVEPFVRFPALVHDQVAGLIADLDAQVSAWAQRMYKAQFLQAPAYAGLDPAKSDGLGLLASQGKHLVEAHHVMNASALRAYLAAFVLALRQQIWSRTGGLSTILMDDPQDLFDPGNVANLAATVSALLAVDMHPVIVSNDFGFIPTIEAFVAAHQATGGPYRSETWEFSAISTSKCTASLAPVADEARTRCDRWQKTNPNDPALARAFVDPVRVRIETKLWDLLASDPSVLRAPTLNDLLGRIAKARNRGERPFNEEPFQRLLNLPLLRAGAPFREVINKAHHGRADQVSPTEADDVRQGYEDVFSAIDACWLAYARFMGRLPAEQRVAEVSRTSSTLTVVSLPARPIPIVSRLAARDVGAALTSVEDATETFDLASLGEVSLFTLRAPTLGIVAFTGQTLIVSTSAEVRNGDFAVIQTPGKIYARRVGIAKGDLSYISLETMPSANSGGPPTHFVQRSSARLSKVVGVLFDEATPAKSQDEAVFVASSPVLDQVVATGRVAGDSAFPVALDRGHVLLGQPPALSLLNGRILAVVAQANERATEYFAYLKRLGKPMPGAASVFYLENVGQSGEGEYVQFVAGGVAPVSGVPVVQQYWKVLGTIFP